MGRHSLALAAIVAVAATAACARDAATPPPTPSASVTTSPSTPSTTPPTTRSTTTRPPLTTPAKGEVTLRGTAEEGVEAGCVIFRADGGSTYLLLGGDRTVVAPGRRLEIVGRPDPDILTTCQQGTPFRVSHARVL